jgi:hypothetical protein
MGFGGLALAMGLKAARLPLRATKLGAGMLSMGSQVSLVVPALLLHLPNLDRPMKNHSTADDTFISQAIEA